jgi:DNA polymerase III epsilon subunit-like protein
MSLHLMLDYETLGHIPPNVATLSLGAVLFNRNEIVDKEYYIFSKRDQIE